MRICSPAMTQTSCVRQREDEPAAVTGLAFDPDAAAVQLDEALRECETEAGTFALLHADVVPTLNQKPLREVGAP